QCRLLDVDAPGPLAEPDSAAGGPATLEKPAASTAWPAPAHSPHHPALRKEFPGLLDRHSLKSPHSESVIKSVNIGQPRLPPAISLHLVARPLNPRVDRKSTRLNSSHVKISYAIFCLKKKKK